MQVVIHLDPFALMYERGFRLFTPICIDLLVEMYMLQRLSRETRMTLSFFHTFTNDIQTVYQENRDRSWGL